MHSIPKYPYWDGIPERKLKENMKPFNLERALAGDPVVTRDGKPVTQIKTFDGIKKDRCVVGVIDNELFVFNSFGRSPYTEGYDLFMAPKMTKYYVHIYSDYSNKIRSSPLIKKSWVEYCTNPNCKLIKEVLIEIEE